MTVKVISQELSEELAIGTILFWYLNAKFILGLAHDGWMHRLFELDTVDLS